MSTIEYIDMVIEIMCNTLKNYRVASVTITRFYTDCQRHKARHECNFLTAQECLGVIVDGYTYLLSRIDFS